MLLIDAHLHVVHARPSPLPQLCRTSPGHAGRGCCKPGAARQEPERVCVPGLCGAACIISRLIRGLGRHRTGVLAVGDERGTGSKAGWDLAGLYPSGPDSALFHPGTRGCCSGMSL